MDRQAALAVVEQITAMQQTVSSKEPQVAIDNVSSLRRVRQLRLETALNMIGNHAHFIDNDPLRLRLRMEIVLMSVFPSLRGLSAPA